MDASTEGLVAAYEHRWTTIQKDTKAEGHVEESEWCVKFTMDASTHGLLAHGQNQDFMLCLLWMPKQMDLL